MSPDMVSYCATHDTYPQPGEPCWQCANQYIVKETERAESAEAALKKAEERADRQRDALKAAVLRVEERRDGAEAQVLYLNDMGREAVGLLEAAESRAQSAEAALKEARELIAELQKWHDRKERLHSESLALAERYREALVKAEAFLDENDYRLPMSGREAAALATIRIALQQGKGEGE
jgi:chromosome segregation ATPase